jgi:multidrug efflux pump subunit AcrB
VKKLAEVGSSAALGTLGPAGRLARAFVSSKLTPLLIVTAVGLGALAIDRLPREEEPQIVVPMVDVFVRMPGASAREVEARVTKPMERLLAEIPGVEYVYSTSSPGESTVIVRFLVGQDEERSLVRLEDKLAAHADLIPSGATAPLIKPRSIDDVPVLALTLWSPRYDGFQLRRVAKELEQAIKEVPDVSQVTVIGGERRQVRVVLDPARLAGRGLTPVAVAEALQAANQRLASGTFARDNREFLVETGAVLHSVNDVRRVVVGAAEGRPVFLGDVAAVLDGPEEPSTYVSYGRGSAKGGASAAPGDSPDGSRPAVTLSIAKRKGVNAVDLVQAVQRKVASLRGTRLPADVHVATTRDYGATAKAKSDELLLHMGIAVFSVALLIGLTLGWREAGIVLLAIPATLALTLTVFFLYGYTLNRITLFALIFSIGILVDDAIVVLENIARHRALPENRGRPLTAIAVAAVDEVGNPTILATMTVVAAILPMAFVGGLMGPYMRPIPVGATAAMVFSLLVAFVVTPWATVRLDKRERDQSAGDAGHSGHAGQGARESATTRLYRRFMTGLLSRPGRRWGFLAIVVVLLLGSMALVATGHVKVKMLPFDNKSELQVIVDLPEGTTLEQTGRVTDALAREVARQPEVLDYQSYVGTSGPFNFNGLVRHYDLRRGSNVADLQVNLVDKGERRLQSHAIAKRIREQLTPLAQRFGARLKVAEVPPGPPVLETLVAEVYGPDYERQIAIARDLRDRMEHLGGVVDVDWYVEDQQPKYRLRVDEEKAALAGVRQDTLVRTLRMVTSGEPVGLLHDERASEDVAIVLRADRATRSDLDRLRALRVEGRGGTLVAVGELIGVEPTVEDHSVYHKNLMPVVYVTADVAGAIESPVYAITRLGQQIEAQTLPEGYRLEQHTARQPDSTERFSMKWDGEWQITYEVFRDLGLAFAVVLVLIYVLVVAWFQSFTTPLIIMSVIPVSLVGILPAHGLLGAFFSATSMIGFIAGAGIVVRNSIILVDFIELRRAQGMALRDAVVDAGAIRFRPMVLTAAAVVLGAGVILFDPIFQGLAISLMAGELASLVLSRVTVPVVYYLVHARRAAGAQRALDEAA